MFQDQFEEVKAGESRTLPWHDTSLQKSSRTYLYKRHLATVLDVDQSTGTVIYQNEQVSKLFMYTSRSSWPEEKKCIPYSGVGAKFRINYQFKIFYIFNIDVEHMGNFRKF